jgi:hypothetical protein
LTLAVVANFEPCAPPNTGTAGVGVRVQVSVGGTVIGVVNYLHLADPHAVGPINNGDEIGTMVSGTRTTCWDGPHVHVEPRNQSGYACFEATPMQAALNGTSELGVLGGAYATGKNQNCPAGAADQPDQDQDGVPDAVDRCPTVPGPASNNGCPPDLVSPALNAVKYADGGVRLYFAPPKVDSSLTVRGYELERSDDGGHTIVSDFNTSQTTSPITASCNSTTTCTYRLRAYFDGTSGAWSAWATAAAVAAPTLNSVKYTNGGASLYFVPPSVPSVLSVRGYELERSDDGGHTIASDFNTGETTSPITASCNSATTCTYRLRAYFDGTSGAWSAWVSAPAVAAPALNSVKYADDGADLYFKPPAVSPDLTIRGYELERSDDGGTTIASDFTTSQTTSPITASCNSATTCTYRLRAYFDGTSGAWSKWQTATF